MVELGGAESFLLDLETNGRIEYNSTIGKYETNFKNTILLGGRKCNNA